jgi:DNA polymerase-3 subunit alpha
MRVYRSQLIEVYEKLLDGVSGSKKKNYEGQLSLFDIANETVQDIKYQLPQLSEYRKKTLLAMEKEISGL